MNLPVYFVSPHAPRREALASSLGESVTVVSSLEALGELEAGPPGVILLDRDDADDGRILDLVYRIARDLPEWRVAVLEGEGSTTLRSLSLGPMLSIGEVAALAENPEASRDTLAGMRFVLDEVAHARHRLNNQLTSALAETQLLLMDVTDDEARESYEIIHRQLCGMRDVIASSLRIGSSCRWT